LVEETPIATVVMAVVLEATVTGVLEAVVMGVLEVQDVGVPDFRAVRVFREAGLEAAMRPGPIAVVMAVSDLVTVVMDRATVLATVMGFMEE
jgi:hypothetical protein